ncbi:hypothetical protein [Palleronia rufa]|uniref:hypothetical protein n=1 Tax=Palleronia rufa TaxID=1530186 RepID=UPI00055BB625|nr:hypothetical protein [Palleronia rufa]
MTEIADAFTDLGREVGRVSDLAAAWRDVRLVHVTADEEEHDANRRRVFFGSKRRRLRLSRICTLAVPAPRAGV